MSDRLRPVAFTLIELLTVLAILGLLLAITLPGLRHARQRSRDARCTTNLRAVGQAILSFAAAHGDQPAPAIRDHDYYWDRGKQIGWDIQTGRWARIRGGPGTIWQCPQLQRAYLGNARALGMDCRETDPQWPCYRVSTSWWEEASRLVLVADLQERWVDQIYPTSTDPQVGDISDEALVLWPDEGSNLRVGNPLLDKWGPHRGRYGVLFADGHSVVANYTAKQALSWAGRRYWEGGGEGEAEPAQEDASRRLAYR